ncbi:MAG TPA: helix-turn-helix domain-containing protein [Cyclobacteriaceae bacterium]|nr:helix-turn-helix domain-containing protein [Cyclobacteriaceae bacterium]HMV07264.1 helix-turn-helix domain-containing protein [Cyclobacteriaceae bacterium]HMV88579.1 helix-turn-helix domain-containing protein [Cyclobacteriaceae bacterium]HMW99381.1 helix-turn-helix domain-containing protein [Cyclobacteriaceae bacterium]HMX48830.1 helix-turn-helix domain-containing protein [Cyclobacteriaceae bacterium]
MLHTSKTPHPSAANSKLSTLKAVVITEQSPEDRLMNNLRSIHDDELYEIRMQLQAIKTELERLRPSGSDELLTMKEVCKMLKLSRPSVHTLIHKKKKLKPVQLLDQDFRFLRKDVEAMIADSYKNLLNGQSPE